MSGAAVPDGSFERFRQLVLRDARLQERLRDTPDRRSFDAAALQLGEELGCPLRAEDLEAAVRDARRAWLERWI